MLSYATGVYVRIFYVLLTERVAVFCMDLRTNSDFSRTALTS